MKKNIYIKILILFVVLSFAGCKKYLDIKADKTLVIPSTIADAQALLDNTSVIYYFFESEVKHSDDDFYVLDSYIDSHANIPYREQYTWDKNATTFQDVSWVTNYQIIDYCNVALETLAKIRPNADQQSAYNLAKGMALFYRGFTHHGLVLTYGLQYDPKTSSSNLGVPYKTTSDINDKSIRLNLTDTYQRILADLKLATEYLPQSTIVKTRPAKSAAYGEIARVYLSMADYKNAQLYADSSLMLNNSLMDYNTLDPSSNAPFSRFNVEDQVHALGGLWGIELYPNWNCDSTLYMSYGNNDLRKVLFFRKNSNGPNSYSYKGCYDQDIYAQNYIGIATDEMFLTRAECYARSGNVSGAMSDLNNLLKTRWVTGTFVPYSASDATSALDIILKERRKELVARGYMRWLDIKRLNLEPRYAKTLTRMFHGTQYTLPPNDLRYAYLIPPSVIVISGMPQNPR